MKNTGFREKELEKGKNKMDWILKYGYKAMHMTHVITISHLEHASCPLLKPLGF